MRNVIPIAYLRRALVYAALLMGLACGRSNPQTQSYVVQRNLSFRGSDYQYFLAAPKDSAQGPPLPVLFLVHGGGGDGLDFLQFWRNFAKQNQIILLAPTLNLGADLERQVPDLFPAFVEDAKKYLRIDTRRVYLFGYSAGGYSTFDAATLDSTYFAAAAVFAGIITPDYDWIVRRARRKMPISLYIGEHDQFFSLAEARRTRELLFANGFPVHYVEIANRDHSYGAVSESVNQDAWSYMSKIALP